MFNGDGSRQLFGTAPGAWELVKGGDGAQVLKEYIRPTNNTYVSISDDGNEIIALRSELEQICWQIWFGVKVIVKHLRRCDSPVDSIEDFSQLPDFQEAAVCPALPHGGAE